jgi:hypothetical protein
LTVEEQYALEEYHHRVIEYFVGRVSKNAAFRLAWEIRCLVCQKLRKTFYETHCFIGSVYTLTFQKEGHSGN